MGETVPLRPGQAALVRMPPGGESLMRPLRDSAAIHETPGDALLSVPLSGAGAYRVEVDLSIVPFPIGDEAYRPWIFSNAVHVSE